MAPYFNGPVLPTIIVSSIANLRAVASNLFVDGMLAKVVRRDDFEWSSSSSLADDGFNVVKPTDVGGNGRWLRFGPIRIAGTSIDAAPVLLTKLDGSAIVVPTDKACMFRLDLVGRCSAGAIAGQMGAMTCNGSIRNLAGTVLMLNNPFWLWDDGSWPTLASNTTAYDGGMSYTCGVAADDPNNSLAVTCTGAAGPPANSFVWSGTLWVTEA